jgi:hypothetical protein
MSVATIERYREASSRFRHGKSSLYDGWETFSTAELEQYARQRGLLHGERLSRQELTRRLSASRITPPSTE